MGPSLASARFLWLHNLAMTSRVSATKKIGRPATGKGTPVQVRLQPDQLAAVDSWAARQKDAPSRPEAIRRLVGKALVE